MLYELHYISPGGDGPHEKSFLQSCGFRIRIEPGSPNTFVQRHLRHGALLFIDNASARRFPVSDWQPVLDSAHRFRIICYKEDAGENLIDHPSIIRIDTRDDLVILLNNLKQATFLERLKAVFASSEMMAADLMRSLMESLQEGVLLIGPSGRILYSNSHAEQLAGVRGGPFVGTRVYKDGLKYFDRSGRPLAKSEHPAHLAFRTGATIEQFRLGIESPGGWHWYSLNAMPLRSKKSNRIRFVLQTIRPETMETNLRKELTATRLRFEKLLAAIPAVIYLVDLESGKSRSLNDQIQNLLGYTVSDLEEFSSDFLTTLMDDSYRQQVLRTRRAALTSHEDDLMEHVVRLRARDGRWKWFHIKETVFDRSADGTPLQLLGTGLDLTDVMESSRVITEQGLLISGIFHLTPIMILLRDEEGLILSANREFEEKTGYTSRDIMEKRLIDFLISEDHEKAQSYLEVLIHQSRYESFEARMAVKDGSIKSVLISSAVIKNIEGQNLYILTVIEDITEFRSLQEKMAESRRMESLDAMAGGIAHDFNNILQGLSNFNRLLTMEFSQFRQSLDAEVQLRMESFFGNQRKLIDRGADITGQILEYSRRKELSPVVLDLRHELQDFLAIYRAQIRDGVRLEVNLEPAHIPVIGNRVAFQRLLQNLFENALNALKGSEKRLLRILLDRVSLETRPRGAIFEIAPGEYGRLVFYDTGCGIREDSIQRIFDPFYTLWPADPGTGLGLALVYSTVRRMHGGIAVQSQPKEFTEISLYLPVRKDVVTEGVQE